MWTVKRDEKKDRKRAVERCDIEKQYQSAPSFSDRLPWCDWSDQRHIMLLEDRYSVGAALEVRDLPIEVASQERIEALHQKMTHLFSTVVPLCDEDPWVLQFFIQDELTLDPLYNRLKDYIQEKNKQRTCDDPFIKKYLSVYQHHFNLLSRAEGLFLDPMSGLPFRGRMRRIRLLFYRRYQSPRHSSPVDVVEELEKTASVLTSRLNQAGIRVRRLQGEHFYEWYVRWFNARSAKQLLEKFPYPKESKPFGWNFSQNVFFNKIESDGQNWIFDDLKHKVLIFQDLQNTVDIGVISRERAFGNGDQRYALLDKLPPGSIYTIQIVFESKQRIVKHLETVEKAAVGKNETIKTILGNINRARYEINEKNNALFRCVEALYIRGKDNKELTDIETHLNALFMDSGLLLQNSSQELYPLDAYLRFLPFNFNYHFDKKEAFRSSYQYADDVARLLPIYGRSRGDGMYPLFIFYNRGGEFFIFDHLNKRFKMSNSHMAIIGTTGAGKSVVLNNFCMSLSAVYDPHIIAIEVGGSFDLTALYFKEHGRKVGTLKFDRQNPLAMNPYTEAYKALALIEQEEAFLKETAIARGEQLDQTYVETTVLIKHAEIVIEEINEKSHLATDKEMECAEDRDILNEMMLATRIMITRGDPKEEDKLDLTDMTLINRGLIKAMKRCREAGVKQMLVHHVAETLHLLAEEEKNQKLEARLKEFAMRLEYFVQDTVRGKFINREAEPLDTYDFLQIDFGFMQSETYQDLLNITCISILSKILALAEANKASGRATCLIIDEIHVILKCPMLAVFIILIAKVARKLGLWLTVCTNNMNDFSGLESKKVLSMMETWLCLALDREEVKLLEQFKPLTEVMRDLVMDIRKYPGIYSEGVLLGKRVCGLFRNVPPRVSLSLAMTEQDERTERKRIQKEKGLTELQAVDYIAKQLEEAPIALHQEGVFL
jgi:conjugative transfer ATPase